ncbi:MAG: flagellar type III secretion system protein FliR [Veillonellaceae bacterium]|uniref:flagellar biosynthetic protein FliR n=1 Tax=uncultured Selenomonas sp. TaxID=159275 RepID=UPI0025CE71D0|nr:flagellar biosynthetic protein FliR [uncultured Selenomonas sp.]MCI7541363.1 flagellar type III secretion system protein FliR [Veillonellaceae bacterium]MDD6126854.1 flagellar biosynthetic protein FliR [Veillonellaceae bacterium]MDD6698110.1 flagellar biosynthetic protein FliR [Veillonellaceae bacterium]MDY6349687.1 flagellar biosynthetic protein FliR [Selenomonas sp.]
MDLFTLLQDHAAVFLLMLTRCSGIFLIAPFFGSLNIPIMVRAATAFMFAVVLFPVVDGLGPVDAPTSVLMYTVAVLKELFIGWLIGFVAYVCFSAIHMAGKVMDMQVGFAVVNVMDPTSGQQIPLIGSFLYNLGIIVFLVTNGHHMIITALAESFRVVPLLTMQPNLSLTMIMVNFTNGIFVTGMKIAMPVTFAILLVNVALGILARTMPQMNIFVVGIPLQLMVGVSILAMLLPFYVMFLGGMFDEMYGKISIALQALQ